MATTIARKNWTDASGSVPVVHKNDIYVVSGQFALASGREAYAQTIEAVIETVRGELQLDTEKGIPYFTTVFESRRALETWAFAVREAVSGLPFVESIVSFEYGIEGSVLSYELTVRTDEGTATVRNEEGAT